MSIDIPTSHKANITIEFGQLQKIVDWCERNCVSEFWYSGGNDIWDGDRLYYEYEFYFESDKDYFAFMIWKK